MVLENLVKGVKYVAGGLALGASMLFGGGCSTDTDVDMKITELSEFKAIAGDRQVDLTWKNPTTLEVPGVKLMRKINYFPEDENDGDIVYEGTAESYADTDVVEDQNYCYRAFSFSYSDPQIIFCSKDASATPFSTTTRTEPVFVGWIGGGSDGWKTGPGASSGTDYQSFYNPTSLFVSGNGEIFISDWYTDRICKWDSSGKAIGSSLGSGWSTNDANTSLSAFVDIAQDSNGNIFVVGYDDCVYKFNSNGVCTSWIGGGYDGWRTDFSNGMALCSSGSGYKYFNNPSGISLDTSDNIYVTDQNNHRVCKWDANGNALGWIGGGSDGWKTIDGASSGNDYQSFSNPEDLFVRNGLIFITDRLNHRVCIWRYGDGGAAGWIGGGYPFGAFKTDNGTNAGSGSYEYSNPEGIFVDDSNIYVADSQNNRVSVIQYTPTVIFRRVITGFWNPDDVFKDNNGSLYVTDTYNNKVCKWQD